MRESWRANDKLIYLKFWQYIMERISVEKLLENPQNNEHYVVEGIPTGMYADRQSYGNRPILILILENELLCKATARPISTAPRVKEGKQAYKELELGDIQDMIVYRCYDPSNEELGLAAAFIDQAIRQKSKVEAHGDYLDDVLEVDFIRVGKRGFSFIEYKFPSTE